MPLFNPTTVADGSITSAKIADGAVVDADVNASAAIAQSKIANLATDLSTLTSAIASKLDTSSAVSFPQVVIHGSTASTPRPSWAGSVFWIGTVNPSNRDLSKDVWFEATVSFAGPLDGLTTPFRALSVRRLLSAYSGPAMKVRRSNDNAELDIGFDSSGNLDTAALLAHVGANSGYVTTWYDQSGNTRHVTQATSGFQPRIVNSGTVDVVGARPGILFDGTDDWMSSAAVGLYAAGATTMAGVIKLGGSATAAAISEQATGSVISGNQGSYRLMRRITTGAAWNVQLNNGAQQYGLTASGDTTMDNNQHQIYLLDTGSAVSTWRDNTAVHAAVTATRGTAPTLNLFALGANAGTTPGGWIPGHMQELIFWGSNESSTRTSVSLEEKTYFGTS